MNPKNKLKLKASQDFNLLICRVKAETLIIKNTVQVQVGYLVIN